MRSSNTLIGLDLVGGRGISTHVRPCNPSPFGMLAQWVGGWVGTRQDNAATTTMAGDAVHPGGIIIARTPAGLMPIDDDDDDNNNGMMRASGNWMVSGTPMRVSGTPMARAV